MPVLIVHSPEPTNWGFTLFAVIIITVFLAILFVMVRILNQGKKQKKTKMTLYSNYLNIALSCDM